jgi:glycosyltransferase involved in cell wall biosynthesis
VKVGVVLPLYNQHPTYIQECLQSMEKQIFRDFRMIVVIDGANNETVEAFNQYKDECSFPISVINRRENRGIAYSLNEGFAQMTDTPYYTWISSDNRYYPNFLGSLVQAMDHATQETVLVYSLFDLIDAYGNNDRLANQQRRHSLALAMNRPKNQIRQTCFIGASFLFKKDIFHEIGGYNPTYEKVEDYEFWMRLLQYGDLTFIEESLMEYRIDGEYSYTTITPKEEINLLSARARTDIWRRFLPMPRITVIVSAYNQERYIEQTISSVLNQTFQDFQFIIIDDGSTDGTWERIHQSRDARINPIHISNKGKSAAFNIALQYVLGEYVLELDGDDWLEPNALEIMVSRMDKASPKYGMAFGNRMIWYQQDEGVVQGPVFKGRRYWNKYDVIRAAQTHCPRLYRLSALRRVGGWPEDIRGERSIVEDFQLMLRLARYYRFLWIPRTLYHQRRHSNNTTELDAKTCLRQLQWVIYDSLKSWGGQYYAVIQSSNGYISRIKLIRKSERIKKSTSSLKKRRLSKRVNKRKNDRPR